MTLFAEDSHANRSVVPGSNEARKMTVTSGRKCLELYQNLSPLGCLVRMLLESSIWHSTRCFLTWKTKATKSKRLLFQLLESEPRIGGTGYGLLPTPVASQLISQWASAKYLLYNNGVRNSGAKVGSNLSWLLSKWHLQNGGQEDCLIPDPCLSEMMMGYPIGYTDLKPLETP